MYKKLAPAFLLAFLGLAATASAEVPTDISGLITDATTVWTGVQGVIVAIVVFTVLIRIAKKIRG